MGTGIHGGFGATEGFKGIEVLPNNDSDNKAGDKVDSVSEEKNKVTLPEGESQLKHIFGDRPGHLPDTEANRKLLVDLANDKSKYVGKDKYGNSWNIETTEDGQQNWVRYQNGKINEGGRNATPRTWDSETGLYDNPFKNHNGGKK